MVIIQARGQLSVMLRPKAIYLINCDFCRSPDHIVYLKQPPASMKDEDHMGRRRGSKGTRNLSYDVAPQGYDGKLLGIHDFHFVVAVLLPRLI